MQPPHGAWVTKANTSSGSNSCISRHRQRTHFIIHILFCKQRSTFVSVWQRVLEGLFSMSRAVALVSSKPRNGNCTHSSLGCRDVTLTTSVSPHIKNSNYIRMV